MIHSFDYQPSGSLGHTTDPDLNPGFFAWLGALLLVASIAVFCSGCGGGVSPSTQISQAEADAVVALAFGADPILADGDELEPSPTPDDDRLKPGQTCPTCKGSGESGDGRPGMCGVCSGDGRIDREDIVTQPAPERADAPAVKRIVWMYTLPNCPPCEAFKRVDIPKLEKEGVEVHIAKEMAIRGPSFRLYQDGEEVASVIGYVSAEWMMKKFDEHKPKGG